MSWRVLLVCLVAALCVPAAWAQRPPETHPASEQRDIVMTWDRSAMPADIELWAPKTVLGYERLGTLSYGELFLTCRSNSDAATGRCPTADTLENLPSISSIIPVRFAERRSGMQAEIEFTAQLQRADATAACSLDYWASTIRPIWSSAAATCNGQKPVGTGVSLRLDAHQLTKLVAGRWTGNLVLLLQTPSAGVIATYAFAFDFTITDHNAAAIYLPEFGHATPTVGLNLRYDPFAHTIGGSKQADVCLYDGLGSQSQYLGLTVRDTSGHTPGPTGFSVWHDDGGTNARRRLDYTLTLNHAGARVPLTNGQEHQLRNIDSVPLRLVVLPGMTYPVYCVPTPITFETPLVPSTSKDAGHYGGSLHVELRVPTSSP